MYHYLGIGQRKALTLSAARKQECTHRCCHADTDGIYITLDMIHGVVNSQAVHNGAARTVDVEENVLLGIVCFQEQHLSDDRARCGVIYIFGKENDSVLQKAGIEVVGTLTTRNLLDDIRNKTHNKMLAKFIPELYLLLSV